MTIPPPPFREPPGSVLVRMLSRLVPRDSREEWVAEWRGELVAAAKQAVLRDEPATLTTVRLWRRCLGATTDALWLRHHHGEPIVLGTDLRQAARSLRHRPGYVAVVVLTLALGIGATTAVFSVVNGVLLRPLPLPHVERLVALEGQPTDGDLEKVNQWTSYPDYADLRDRTHSFEQLAARRRWQVTLTARDAEPARLNVTYTTANFVTATGLLPLLGRNFRVADAEPGAPAVALLSEQLWRGRFLGDRGVVGQQIQLDGVPTEIIGVLPGALQTIENGDLIQPIAAGPMESARGAHRLTVLGRLRDGVTIVQAESELRLVASQLEKQYPENNAKRSAKLLPMQAQLVGSAETSILVLFGAIVLLLLIACTNLAALFLTRAASREREMAVREALGASRAQLARQWGAESFLLTAAGGVFGVVVAWLGMRALLGAAPASLPRASEIGLDLPVLLFLGAVSVAVGLLFGVLPAVQRRRDGAFAALRSGGRSNTEGRRKRGMRSTLVVAEVALATVLAIGSALLVKNLYRMQHAPLSIRPDAVYTTQIQLPNTRYAQAGPDGGRRTLDFYRRLREEVAAIPGIHSVALAYQHPLAEGWTTSYHIAGGEHVAAGLEPEARVRPVSPGYFDAVGLRLLEGRDVTDRDRIDMPGVMVVNQAFARRHFPGRSAVGQAIEHGSPWWPGQPTHFEIVGVVADEPFLGIGRPADPATYFPHSQYPFNEMWLVVTSERSSASLYPDIRSRIWRIDPLLPVDPVVSLRGLMGDAVAEPTFNAVLLSLFAATALLLAAIGIYGVLSYTVSQRTAEIGLRMALGADRDLVRRQIVGQGLMLVGGGAVAGLAGAWALARVLESLLLGVSGRDPLSFLGVAVVLLAVAVLAAWLPAHRASRIEPVVALRAE
ncbi:MAG: ABC transporter permease [Gemmatimonadales bacterium]